MKMYINRHPREEYSANENTDRKKYEANEAILLVNISTLAARQTLSVDYRLLLAFIFHSIKVFREHVFDCVLNASDGDDVGMFVLMLSIHLTLESACHQTRTFRPKSKKYEERTTTPTTPEAITQNRRRRTIPQKKKEEKNNITRRSIKRGDLLRFRLAFATMIITTYHKL
jgi:hypothetical protein